MAQMPQGQHGIWPACPKARLPQLPKARAHLCYRAPSSVCAKAHFHQGPHAPELDCPEPRDPWLARPKARTHHGPHAPGSFFFLERALGPARHNGRAPKICMLFPVCDIHFPTTPQGQTSARPQIWVPRNPYAISATGQEFWLPRQPPAKNSNGQQLLVTRAPPAEVAASQELTLYAMISRQ